MTRRATIHGLYCPGQRRHRGLAMVEFTIAAPMLLLLLYAIAEFGNVFYQYAQLADGARNADRYLGQNAILGGSGVVSISTTVSDATKSLVVYGNTSGSGTPLLPGLAVGQVTVATQADPDGSTDVTVSVAYPYQSLFGGSIPSFVSAGTIGTAFTLNVFTSMHAL
jgi:Flp pilus assembly protein TadG